MTSSKRNSSGLSKRRELLIGATIFLVLFATIELALRFVGVDRPMRAPLLVRAVDVDISFPFMKADRELFWSLKPGFRGEFLGKPVTINSHGLRGPEIPVPKPKGRIRVLFFGDSITFGYGVGDEESYSFQFGKLLAPRGVEAINGGVTGYSSYQVLRLLRRVAPELEADLALFCVGWNDGAKRPVDDNAYARGIRIAMSLEWLAEYVYLYRSIKGLYVRSVKTDWDRLGHAVRATPEQYEANLKSIVRECRSRQILPVFIDLPRRKRTEEPLFHSRYAQTLREVAATLDVPLIDPGDLGLETPLLSNEHYFIDTLHLTPEGHAYLAERLVKELAEQGLL